MNNFKSFFLSHKIISKLFFAIFLLFNFEFAFAQTSSLVAVGVDGKLIYTADSKGNTVPDFSGVGYMNSESEIPFVPVVLVVNAVAGDNLSNVQNAINTVSAMPLNSNGFRGAILFKAGVYNISDTIKISSSGIVLRGEGYGTTGTRFIATKTSQYSLFYFAGNNGISEISSSKKSITDKYVPIGTKNITVAAGHSFQVGDNVLVHRIPKNSWIDLLTMAQWGWTASAYDINYERKIKAVNGNSITLDAPIVDIIDTAYATGELIKYTSARIEKCGIENMRISSTYISDIDENHGWEAVTFYNIINAWAKNLEVYYFGYSAVHVLDGAAWVTIDSCKMYDAKSTVDGGRRYSFNVDGQRTLVQNCVTRNGRHDYVNGSRTPGPVVFYNSQSTLQLNDIGPHHRWSTGILFDNILGDGRMDMQNRTSSGTGHGWAGAQTMFWNCKGNRMVIHDPQGDERNWAIGCIFNEVTNVGDMTTEPLGFVESSGTRIAAIPSLFSAQLNERLTPLRQNQTITFPVISTKYLFSSDFNPNAIASSGLTITYTSSNPSVATFINGLLHITGVGTTTITASQAGNYYYINPANSISQNLTVSGTYNYNPDTSFLLQGSMCNCTLKNDTTANNIYHIVKSTTTSNPKTDWFTSTFINQPASSYNKLILNLKIKYSKNINQVIYLYKWSYNSWSQIDNREVTNTDSNITLNILNYSSFISPQGQIRMRVFANGDVTNFTCFADWISFSAEY